MSTVPADLGFQLPCATQALQCQGKRLYERPFHPARAGICSQCWPPALAIHHHGVPAHLHSVLLSASSHGDASLEKGRLPQAPHQPSKGCATALHGSARLCTAAGSQGGTAGPTILGSGKGSSSLCISTALTRSGSDVPCSIPVQSEGSSESRVLRGEEWECGLHSPACFFLALQLKRGEKLMKTELWKKRQAWSGFRPDPQQLSATCQMFRCDANVRENKSVSGSRSLPGRHAAAHGSAPHQAGQGCGPAAAASSRQPLFPWEAPASHRPLAIFAARCFRG